MLNRQFTEGRDEIMPFDPEKGPGFIKETIRVIDNITACIEDKRKIYEGNARRLLKLD
jgi:hypothetical protein